MSRESDDRHHVTKLIHRLREGEAAAADELLPLVYEELRAIARRLFQRQPEAQTLQPTALVHEAWLKLARQEDGWDTRGHFFSVAAMAMRQILTDHARARRSDRRGKGWRKVTLDEHLIAKQQEYDLLDIDDALRQLAEANERYARVVELHLFAGLSLAEIAGVLDLTPRTVQMDWRAARAFLGYVLSVDRV